MPLTCSVCAHPESFVINEAILGVGENGKLSNRAIAKRYGVDDSSVQRHKAHIPQLLVKASSSEEIAQADVLLDDIARIRAAAFRALDRAEASDDVPTMLRAIREARENVRILGELRGELNVQAQTRAYISPVAMQVLIQVLQPYPDLAEAVVDALEPLEAGDE
jgi:hypothetical protein